MPARRSVVKIKNACGANPGTAYSNSATKIGSWTTDASPDACVASYLTLDDNTLTISAMAIDGDDSLWVRHAYLCAV